MVFRMTDPIVQTRVYISSGDAIYWTYPYWPGEDGAIRDEEKDNIIKAADFLVDHQGSSYICHPQKGINLAPIVIDGSSWEFLKKWEKLAKALEQYTGQSRVLIVVL